MTDSSEPASTPKRTPLYAAHQSLGAKIIDFGGWAMPLQYTGILDEHRAVRGAVGIFDVSHMGEVGFHGPRAAEAVQRCITNDVGKLSDGKALYTTVCYPDGGIVDDCIVYREAADRYLIVVNASNTNKDFSWFDEHAGSTCDVRNVSDVFGLLAVQGPRAVELLAGLCPLPLSSVAGFHFLDTEIAGIGVRAARTGYTGEDGFELFVAAGQTEALWNAILAAGQSVGIKPIGLGARDTLRLEAKLSLYGNDIDADHSPLEAGLGWVVKGKGYIGEDALAAQAAAGVTRKLVGFVMKDRAIARHGYNILGADGAPIGVVTSGTVGPTVGLNIGLGYVPAAIATPGTRLVIDCRGKQAAAEVVQGPFYKRPRPQPAAGKAS